MIFFCHFPYFPHQWSNIINEAWCDLTRPNLIHCTACHCKVNYILDVVGICHLRKLSFIRLRTVICFNQSFLVKTLCFRFSQDIFGWLPALICANLTFRCKLKSSAYTPSNGAGCKDSHLLELHLLCGIVICQSDTKVWLKSILCI